jgi:hypothetical protein
LIAGQIKMAEKMRTSYALVFWQGTIIENHTFMDTTPSGRDSENLQLLVERFHKAGWITGLSMVSSEPFSMNFTTLGLLRMSQLFGVFKGINARNFPDQSDLYATERGRIIIAEYVEALSELSPPRLSSGERDVLIGLTITLANRMSK